MYMLDDELKDIEHQFSHIHTKWPTYVLECGQENNYDMLDTNRLSYTCMHSM